MFPQAMPLADATTMLAPANRRQHSSLTVETTKQALNGLSPRFGKSHSTLALGLEEAKAYVPNSFRSAVFKLNRGLGSKFFRPVVEDFLMGIMAVDFFALWIPRAWTALMRGVMAYDPEQDPEAQKKSGFSEKVYVAKERFKRLNWPNFFEEWWREFASGPGMFIWPTICFSVFRNATDSRRAIQLPQFTLRQLNNQLKDFLGEKPRAKTVDFKAFTNTLVDWDRLFSDRITGSRRNDYQQKLNAHLGKLIDNLEKRSKLEDKHRFANLPLSSKRKKFQAISTQARKAAKDFSYLIERINTRYAGKRFMEHNKLPLTAHWEPGDAGINNQLTTSSNFTQQLDHFYDFVKRAERTAQKNKAPLAKALDTVQKTVLKQKGMFSMATVAVTLGFLFKLVEWTQGNETYVANRTQRLENLPSLDMAGKKATPSAATQLAASPIKPAAKYALTPPPNIPQVINNLPANTLTSQPPLPYNPPYRQEGVQHA
jgi:hypothetical protein